MKRKHETLTACSFNCRYSARFNVSAFNKLMCNLIGNRPQSATFHTANVSTSGERQRHSKLTMKKELNFIEY